MKSKLLTGLIAAAFAVACIATARSAGNSTVSGASTSAVSDASSGAPATPPATDFGPMKTVEIIDPMFNMVAYTLSIPKSWNFEGTVLHGPGCLTESVAVVFRAYSSDMLYGVQMIPTSGFFWADDKRALPEGPAGKILQPMSAGDYGKLIVIRMRPGSVVDSVEPDRDEAVYQAAVEKSNQALAAQAASMGSRNPAKARGSSNAFTSTMTSTAMPKRNGSVSRCPSRIGRFL